MVSAWLEQTSQLHQQLCLQFSLSDLLLWLKPPKLLLHELLTWLLMMKHLLLLLRLQPTPPKRGREGHLKKSLSQNRSLSLSRSLRVTGRRGSLSPSMVTTRSLLLLSSFHLLLSTLLLLQLQPLSTSLNLLPSSTMSQLHLFSLPLSIMFLPTLSLSLSPQPFPLYLHLNLS